MNYTVVDYVWIGGNGELRSKTRVLNISICSIENIPPWNYDGSSTNQADGDSSEIIIYPKLIFRCPFTRLHGNGIIVMCDTYMSNGVPLSNNHRYWAEKIFKKYADQKPWYGLEQEYFIYDNNTGFPVGFDPKQEQGQFYCSVGSKNAFCRKLVEEHMEACLYAGIKISGINAEVAPGQWEYQIGPVEGIDAADQLWISRYILEKLSEKYNVNIVYHPKPLKGNWNGSGCHTNFSTKIMRNPGGYKLILEAINKLREKHSDHMKIYGKNNEERMSGFHETSKYNEFSYGVGNRKVSIRIPNDTVKNGYGYFEDRRPAANMDPYLVTAKILETIME